MKVKLINENYKSRYTDKLLISRGINPDDLNSFYYPTKELLEEPTNLNNVKEGYELLNKHLKNNSKIGLVVDCDVDGFTSAAIIYLYIKNLNPNADIDYFLHSHKQHGLEDMMDNILHGNTEYNLIITPDSSSNDYEFHEELKQNNIEVLILDHHDVDREINSNVVLINNQSSFNYKNKQLSGAGVAWQFCRYIDSFNQTNFADNYIDLAALGCISDMMSSLELENRYIFMEGLHHINNGFFKALVEKQSYSIGEELTPIGVAFYITPLINGMIRVGSQEEKEITFKAFIKPDELIVSKKRGANGALEKISIEAARMCTNARAKQNRILDKAVEELEIKIFKHDLLSNQVLFIRLDEEDYPSELNGLIAMKIANKYKKPTMIGRLNSEGYDKGSIRGVNGSELKDFKGFLQNTGLFEYVQGHPNAAGFDIKDSSLSRFHEVANEELKDINFNENYFEVNFERLAADRDLIDLIEDLGTKKDIWGQQNNEALVHVKDLNLTTKDIQIIGKNQDTVKIEKFGITYLKFRAKEMIQELAEYDEIKMEIVGKPNLNNFMGHITPQFFIEDYQIEDGALGF